MKLKYYLFILFCFCILTSGAQVGGESTYQFLELTNSARIAALGGSQTALLDTTDLNLPYQNPALLHKGMEKKVLVSYVNYLSDINYGYASYAKSFEGIGNFALGMHYINYGNFQEATDLGELTGNQFKAAEYALNIIYSNHYKRLKYGATLKPILSSFESYQSFGMAADFGISFASKNNYTNVALVARNVGGQITTYYNGAERESIPFNLQAGFSRKLMHAPITFSINMQHINHWNLSGKSKTNSGDLISEIYQRDEGFSKQLMRHLIWGVEIYPSPNFILRAGYNYQRRQELKVEEKVAAVGFSFGFGIKIKRFTLDYGIAQYHISGSSSLFSLAINLNDL